MLKKGVIYKGQHGATEDPNDFVMYKVLERLPDGWYSVRIIDESFIHYRIGNIVKFHWDGCKNDKPCYEYNIKQLLKLL